jgi:hypothetical protein
MMNFRERFPRLSQKKLLIVGLITLPLVLLLLGGIALASVNTTASNSVLSSVNVTTSDQAANNPPACNPKVDKVCNEKPIPPADAPIFEGKVTSIQGDTVVVQTPNVTRTFRVNANTAFTKATLQPKQESPATRGNLTVGASVIVKGAVSNGTFVASNIVVIIG